MAEAPTQAPAPAQAPAQARQLGVQREYIPKLIFRFHRIGRNVSELVYTYGVTHGSEVIFDKYGVYVIMRDDAVYKLCDTEVLALHLAGLTPTMEYLHTFLFARYLKGTGCERIYMSESDRTTLACESPVHKATFFREFKPDCEKYDQYVKVCAFFNVNPYTSWPTVNIMWEFVLTTANTAATAATAATTAAATAAATAATVATAAATAATAAVRSA